MAVPPRLVALAALLLLAHAATAGSPAQPEVQDATGDHRLFADGEDAGVPGTGLAAGRAADLVAAWIDNETAERIAVHVQVAAPVSLGAAQVGPVDLIGTISYDYVVSAKAGLRSVTAGVRFAGASQTDATSYRITPLGSAQNASVVGALIHFQVPRSALDNATAGSQLTNLTVSAVGTILDPAASPNPLTVVDRAPSSGFGLNYTFQVDTKGHETVPGGGGGPQNPNGAPGCTYRATELNRSDSDADCLPDRWERQYFPTLAQNGTGDPDGDGCNNRCESLHGTDPTKKDSDNDGVDDGKEIEEGSDPLNPASKPAPATPPGTGTTATTGTDAGSRTATTAAATPATPAAAESPASQSPLDKLEAEAGYAVASGAAMGTIVLLSLVGLFGRWGP